MAKILPHAGRYFPVWVRKWRGLKSYVCSQHRHCADGSSLGWLHSVMYQQPSKDVWSMHRSLPNRVLIWFLFLLLIKTTPSLRWSNMHMESAHAKALMEKKEALHMVPRELWIGSMYWSCLLQAEASGSFQTHSAVLSSLLDSWLIGSRTCSLLPTCQCPIFCKEPCAVTLL